MNAILCKMIKSRGTDETRMPIIVPSHDTRIECTIEFNCLWRSGSRNLHNGHLTYFIFSSSMEQISLSNLIMTPQ